MKKTAFKTNEAAAREIARQLRIRDTGGLIVIDFIDMSSPKNQRGIENVLRDEVRHDRARIQIGRISRFGLLEMSRQRVRPSLEDATQLPCTRCEGQGSIRTVPSLALSILRVIEEEGMKPNSGQVQIQVPVEVATFLLNEKRRAIHEIEDRHGCHVMILPNSDLQTPKYQVERIREEDLDANQGHSFNQVVKVDRSEELVNLAKSKVQNEQPALRTVTPTAPILPRTPKNSENSIISRLWSAVFGSEAKAAMTSQNANRGSDGDSSSDSSSDSRSAAGRGSSDGRGGQNNRRRGSRGGRGRSTGEGQSREQGQDNRNANSGARRSAGGNRGGARQPEADRQGNTADNNAPRSQAASDDSQGQQRRPRAQGGNNTGGNRRRGGGNSTQGSNSAESGNVAQSQGGNRHPRSGNTNRGRPARPTADRANEDSLAMSLPTPEEQLQAKERALSRDPNTAMVIDQPSSVAADTGATAHGSEVDGNRSAEGSPQRTSNNRRRRRGQYGSRRKDEGDNTSSASATSQPSVASIEVQAPSDKTEHSSPTSDAPAVIETSRPAPAAKPAPAQPVAAAAAAKAAAAKAAEAPASVAAAPPAQPVAAAAAAKAAAAKASVAAAPPAQPVAAAAAAKAAAAKAAEAPASVAAAPPAQPVAAAAAAKAAAAKAAEASASVAVAPPAQPVAAAAAAKAAAAKAAPKAAEAAPPAQPVAAAVVKPVVVKPAPVKPAVVKPEVAKQPEKKALPKRTASRQAPPVSPMAAEQPKLQQVSSKRTQATTSDTSDKSSSEG